MLWHLLGWPLQTVVCSFGTNYGGHLLTDFELFKGRQAYTGAQLDHHGSILARKHRAVKPSAGTARHDGLTIKSFIRLLLRLISVIVYKDIYQKNIHRNLNLLKSELHDSVWMIMNQIIKTLLLNCSVPGIKILIWRNLYSHTSQCCQT